MHIRNPFFSALRATATATLFVGAATLNLQAQQSAGLAATSLLSSQPSSPLYAAATPISALPLLALNEAPADDSSSSLSYSSSVGSAETANAENFNLSPGDASPQPPPRRYGRRPVYADSHHNADGSNKYGFLVGGGFTLPTGGTHNYLSTSYDFQGGIIRNFNKKFGVALQFDWHNFGLQTSTLNSQLALYDDLGATDSSGDALSQLGGSSHLWSFTLDPTYTYYQGDKYGAYVVGGVGFYHKSTVFTTPGTGEYCDPYYGCYEYEANEPIDDYTSNAAGFNGGVGFTYKPSRFGDIKFYGEARYVYVANSPRAGYTLYDYDNNLNSTYTGTNLFPQNSAKTTYIPVTFGIRF